MSPKPNVAKKIPATRHLGYVVGAVVLGAVGLTGWYLWSRTTNVPEVVQGPKVVADPEGVSLNTNVAVDGSDVQFRSAVRTKTFRTLVAPEGKDIVAVTFDAIRGSGLAVAAEAQGATLRSNGESAAPLLIEVPSTADSQSTGTIAFEIPSGRTEFELTLGATKVPFTVPL